MQKETTKTRQMIVNVNILGLLCKKRLEKENKTPGGLYPNLLSRCPTLFFFCAQNIKHGVIRKSCQS